MPHKHRRMGDDKTQFNLPPTEQATALPVGKARTFRTATKSKKRKAAHIDGYGADDTPRAFQRLMARAHGGVKKRSGLDHGLVRTKRQKKQQARAQAEQDTGAQSEAQPKQPATCVLKMQPGESMAEFGTRVDQALPISGVARSGKKVAGVRDHRVTKHERHLKRLQKGWREEEARMREKEVEEAEVAEEDQEEVDAMWEDKTEDLPPTLDGKKKKNRKGRRKTVVGEVDNGSEDEWEALKRKRGERKGLHDVVSAPPTFTKVPREIFKVKKVGHVPNSAGSLRKREELGEERKTMIERYRELMAAKNEKQAGAATATATEA